MLKGIPVSYTHLDVYKRQIDDSIKKERFSRLLDLQNQISYEKNLAYEGKIIEVLVCLLYTSQQTNS